VRHSFKAIASKYLWVSSSLIFKVSEESLRKPWSPFLCGNMCKSFCIKIIQAKAAVWKQSSEKP